jgi:branched-chain amino acid transport system substrate-binding protein
MKNKRQSSLILACIGICLILVILASMVGCASSPATSAPAPATTTSAPAPTTKAPAPTTSAPAPTTNAPAPTTSAPAPTQASAPKKLKIGNINCLSGFLAPFEVNQENTMEALVKVINDQGGITIAGEKYLIDLLIEDDKSSVDGGLAAANKLVFQDQVKFVNGPIVFIAAATTPLFNQNKIIDVNWYSVSLPGELNKDTPYSFLSNSGALGTAIQMLSVLRKQYPDAKTLSYMAADDGQLNYIIPLLQPFLQQYGFTLAKDAVIAIPMTMEDYTPIANKVNSLHTDVSILNSAPLPAMGAIPKAVRGLGNKMPFAVSTFQDASVLLSMVGAEAANDLITPAVTVDDPNNPALLKAVLAKVPKDTQPMLQCISGMEMFTTVIQKANSFDPEVFKKTWESLDTIDDPLFGKVLMGGDQSYGIRHHVASSPMPYQALQGGKIINLGWVDAAPIP